MSAGNRNEDGAYLDQFTPQNIGSSDADNGLITVGGVTSDGAYWSDTMLDGGLGGSITVYAQAENVVVAWPTSNSDTETVDGTSFAAPAAVSRPDTYPSFC